MSALFCWVKVLQSQWTADPFFAHSMFQNALSSLWVCALDSSFFCLCLSLCQITSAFLCTKTKDLPIRSGCTIVWMAKKPLWMWMYLQPSEHLNLTPCIKTTSIESVRKCGDIKESEFWDFHSPCLPLKEHSMGFFFYLTHRVQLP